MREILGKAKTIRELLSGAKYSIDYYQREFRWQNKQVSELLDDLTDRIRDTGFFLDRLVRWHGILRVQSTLSRIFRDHLLHKTGQ